MPATGDTRYHESGHAVVGVRQRIALKDEGMVLKSDVDAYVSFVEERQNNEDWVVRRVATKLAGPVAMAAHEVAVSDRNAPTFYYAETSP